jgi:hypothetical protein
LTLPPHVRLEISDIIRVARGATHLFVCGVTLVSWDQEFFDPIILPGRKPLVTLRDAAQYITQLPEAERELPQWETAIEWLMLVGEHGGDR